MRRLLCVLLLLVMMTTATGTYADQSATSRPAGVATADFHDPFATPEAKPIEDPLESLNRAFFRFNDLIYRTILAPVCRMVPAEMQERATAALTAFKKPLRVGHVELQFAFRDGGSEAGRFVMHAVIDLLHHFEPASTQGLQNGDEDFGRMLQALGVDSGIYLVLPVFGPSSLRDGIGHIASFYLDPSPGLCNPDFRKKVAGTTSLASVLDAYEEIRRQTLDPYLFLRDAYVQQVASAERKVQLTQAAPAAPPRKPGRHEAAVFL